MTRSIPSFAPVSTPLTCIFPRPALEVRLFDGCEAIHPAREPQRVQALAEGPQPCDTPQMFGIARFAFLERVKPLNRYQSSKRNFRRRASASIRSTGRRVSFFIR